MCISRDTFSIRPRGLHDLTSDFSTPLSLYWLSGLVACLWQSTPESDPGPKASNNLRSALVSHFHISNAISPAAVGRATLDYGDMSSVSHAVASSPPSSPDNAAPTLAAACAAQVHRHAAVFAIKPTLITLWLRNEAPALPKSLSKELSKTATRDRARATAALDLTDSTTPSASSSLVATATA